MTDDELAGLILRQRAGSALRRAIRDKARLPDYTKSLHFVEPGVTKHPDEPNPAERSRLVLELYSGDDPPTVRHYGAASRKNARRHIGVGLNWVRVVLADQVEAAEVRSATCALLGKHDRKILNRNR